MFKTTHFFFFFFLISVNISLGQKVTSYYLIRHAEKVLTNLNNDSNVLCIGDYSCNVPDKVFEPAASLI